VIDCCYTRSYNIVVSIVPAPSEELKLEIIISSLFYDVVCFPFQFDREEVSFIDGALVYNYVRRESKSIPPTSDWASPQLTISFVNYVFQSILDIERFNSLQVSVVFAIHSYVLQPFFVQSPNLALQMIGKSMRDRSLAYNSGA